MIILFCSLVFILAGMVKGLLGMGLPTVAVGLLALAMTPAEAAALLLIPSLATNLWQMLIGPALWQLIRQLWLMMTTLCLGTLLTTHWLIASNNDLIAALLGLVLMMYGCVGMLPYRMPKISSHNGIVSAIMGLMTGLVTGATGVFVMPAVPYIQALNLGKERLIQALGLSFTVSTLALGFGLFWQGGLETVNAGESCLMLAPALVGLGLGQWIRGRLSEALFRRFFFIGLLVLGLYSFIRAII